MARRHRQKSGFSSAPSDTAVPGMLASMPETFRDASLTAKGNYPILVGSPHRRPRLRVAEAMNLGSMEASSLAAKRVANLQRGNPNWVKGVSANPGGVPKGGTFTQRYEAKLASFTEDLGHEPSGIELELLQQASLMATRADDLRRRMSRGKPVKDEDLSRLANGAARILLRLRVKRNESGQPQESLRDYAARRKSGAA